MIKPNKIAKVVVGLPVDGPFDYEVSKDFRDRISVGQRVRISFNRRNRVGFVVGAASRSTFKNLNPVLSILDNGPVLDEKAFACAKAFSAYYGCSLGEAIETFLPAALRQDKPSLSCAVASASVKEDSALNNRAVLVHDQTPHKRWPFIIERIQKVVDAGKKAIVLVPEVSFIKETASILTAALSCPTIVFDKKLPPNKELEQWERIRKGEFMVIIGTRSAVFAPVPELGLIVVDEEENSAYKQEQSPHYHAHEVAQMRAHIEQCQLIFISSLPSAGLWEKARRYKWERITFQDDSPGAIQIIDMTNYNPQKTSILSFPLQNSMQKTLEANGNIILFMNRLGFSTQTHCQQCGLILKCQRCNVNLTYLYSKKTLVCRHCNFKMNLPKICPECQGSYLRSTGTGVEKLESEVTRLYPHARVRCYDRQSEVFPKEADIIIATQAVFRQHERWTASLVAVLNFDVQLYHADFRSGHKAFSLLVHLNQLAKEKLVIQTRMADNYCIKAMKSGNFSKFYREELKLRKSLDLPPYKNLVAVGLRGKNENSVFEQSQAFYSQLEENKSSGIVISDPHPDVNPKLRDKYRFTIVLKGKSVKNMLAHIKSTLKHFRKKGVTVTINVDP